MLVWDTAIIPKYAVFFWLTTRGQVISYEFSTEISVKQGIIYSFNCSFASRPWKKVVWQALEESGMGMFKAAGECSLA